MNNLPVWFTPVPQVLMLQQANMIRTAPVKHGFKEKMWFFAQRLIFRFGIRSCSRIIVQTPVMKQWLSEAFPEAKDKTVVISSGYVKGPSSGQPDVEIAACFKKFSGIKALCVSHYYPTKNLDILIGVAKLAKNKSLDMKLFMTLDPCDAGSSKFLSSVKNNGLEDLFVNLGTLTREQVVAAYQNADLMVLPTLLESFGLVFLEAMENGCPVVTSDLDFARHVCGDAALYFDPSSPDSILSAITSLSSDRLLRLALIEKGRNRVEMRFMPWQKVAEQYIEVIKGASE